MKEREISLVDLVVEILLRWRVMIVVMLVGGVLMGGLGYLKSGQAQKAQTEQMNQNASLDQEGWESKLTTTQISNVTAVLNYEKLEKYIAQSVIMQLDSMSVPKSELTFWISAETQEQGESIEKAYEDLVTSGGLYDYLAVQHNISSSVVSEIVFLEKNGYGVSKNVGSLQVAVERAQDVLRVSVIHADEEMCRKLAQSVLDYIAIRQKELEKLLGTHEVILLDQSFAVVSDIDIMDRQKTVLNDLTARKAAATKNKDAFSDLEKQYYNYMQNVENVSRKDTVEGTNNTTMTSPSISVKYIVLGMVLAAFVYAFILFLQYVLNTKIRETDNLQELYDIPQLGQIPGTQKKKLLGVVDRWILSLRNRNKRQFTPEEALELATVGIKMAAGKAELSNAYLIGCDLKGTTQEVCAGLKAKLEKENLQVTLLNNVLYDASAMEELSNAKGAVLVAKAGATFYDEIVKELELLKRQGIAVLGGIVVE